MTAGSEVSPDDPEPTCMGLGVPKDACRSDAHSAVLVAVHRKIVERVVGGADRDRTDDLRLAKPALSQLSYSPQSKRWWAWEDLNFRPHAYQACALTN